MTTFKQEVWTSKTGAILSEEYFETLSEVQHFETSKEYKSRYPFARRKLAEDVLCRSCFFFSIVRKGVAKDWQLTRYSRPAEKRKLENKRRTSGFSKCFQKEGFGYELAKLTKHPGENIDKYMS